MAQHFHPIPVAAVTREAEDAVAVRLAVPADLKAVFAFKPGQHLTLRRELNGVDERRSYSLCSGVLDDQWRLGIRSVPGGAFSTWATESLRAGDVLECMTPDGSFFPLLDAAHAKHYLLIAAGSGITPLLSIARSVLSVEPHSQVTLLYGNRRLSSVMFREDLEDLKNTYLQRFSLHHVFSREPQEIALANGRLDADKLRDFLSVLIPPQTLDDVFLCGPNAMLDALVPVLREAGIAEDAIHVERFGVDVVPATERAPAAQGPEARVTVIADGVTRELRLATDGVSILDAARDAGLDLPFSCKSGVCSTCRARLKEGTVHMTRNFALMQSDLDAGFVLTCQAHPTSEKVTISFDDR